MHQLCHKTFFIFISINFIITVLGDLACNPRKYTYDSVVCVCNATYCDQISKIIKQPPGTYLLYSSTRSGLRFSKTEGKLSEYNEDPPRSLNDWYRIFLITFNLSPNTEEMIFYINRDKRYQTMKGFGGAFTDSASMNFKKLGEKTQQKLVESYYSENGIEYNMGRVPIAGSDFSIRPYAYNMYPENDVTLSNFSLAEEDYDYKIPFIQMAQNVAYHKLNLIGVAWSPPPWMKTNNKLKGPGFLLPKYYQTWADYHIKFLEEYEKKNITFWCMSTGNEPIYGALIFHSFNGLGWTPHSQARWVAENFGPTIKTKYKNMKILTLDDQRFAMPTWVSLMAHNQKAMDYIDGLGLHWYLNKYVPVEFVDNTHNAFPSKFIMSTEACTGTFEQPYNYVKLGAWYRAEILAKDMIESFNHWFVAWMDWNLILNTEGGPNWFGNNVDSSLIALPENDEFVKQPTFYVLGHFSKFVPEGSVRVDLQQTSGAAIDKVAFLRPDGGIAVVILNTHTRAHLITIREKGRGMIELRIPPSSLQTVVYW